MRALFTDIAVQFDLHLHPIHNKYYINLLDEVSEKCYGMFDNDDWYVDGFDEDTLTTTIRNRKSSVILFMTITADPMDEDDQQWLIVDIHIDNEPKNQFQ